MGSCDEAILRWDWGRLWVRLGWIGFGKGLTGEGDGELGFEA